jgi:uncharacterized protein YdeI (YjbR/CyaY-like superfamily)
MTTTEKSPSDKNLTRAKQPMPDFVREELESRGLADKYRERPAYQRNDYLMWINQAERDTTKKKRLYQMLEELEGGGVYMGMKWNG